MECNPSGNSNSLFHVGDYIWNVLFLYDFLKIFHVMLRFDKAIYLPFLCKSILSVSLINSPWGSDVSLFLEFINKILIFVLYLH